MEDFIGDFAQKGTIHVFEPYRDVHKQNLEIVQDYWKKNPLPVTKN